jgi:hypothetical protein
MYDKFAELKAIARGEAAAPIPTIWNHEINKPLIGTIKGFSRFQHDRYGMQETVIVELETGELVSAILTPYLIDGMQRQHAQENDSVLIQLLGKDVSTHGNSFNKYNLVVQKTQ